MNESEPVLQSPSQKQSTGQTPSRAAVAQGMRTVQDTMSKGKAQAFNLGA